MTVMQDSVDDIVDLERVKIQHETEKLSHEIRVLQVPWYKKSGYLALALSLALALGPTAINSWSGLTAMEEKLSLAERKQDRAVQDMLDAREEAEKALVAEKQTIAILNEMESERLEIENQRNALQQQRLVLVAEKEELQEEVANLKDDMKAVTIQVAEMVSQLNEQKRTTQVAARRASPAESQRLEAEAREAKRQADEAAARLLEAEKRAQEAAEAKRIREEEQKRVAEQRALSLRKELDRLSADALRGTYSPSGMDRYRVWAIP